VLVQTGRKEQEDEENFHYNETVVCINNCNYEHDTTTFEIMHDDFNVCRIFSRVNDCLAKIK
jgi:hypothetical protein